MAETTHQITENQPVLPGQFVIASIPEKPMEEAWRCDIPHGSKYGHVRLGFDVTGKRFAEWREVPQNG